MTFVICDGKYRLVLLVQKGPLVQYISNTSWNPTKMSVSRDNSLVFRFVRGDLRIWNIK